MNSFHESHKEEIQDIQAQLKAIRVQKGQPPPNRGLSSSGRTVNPDYPADRAQLPSEPRGDLAEPLPVSKSLSQPVSGAVPEHLPGYSAEYLIAQWLQQGYTRAEILQALDRTSSEKRSPPPPSPTTPVKSVTRAAPDFAPPPHTGRSIESGTNRGVNREINQEMNREINRGINGGVNREINQGTKPRVEPGINPGTEPHPSPHRHLAQRQSRGIPPLSQVLDSGLVQQPLPVQPQTALPRQTPFLDSDSDLPWDDELAPPSPSSPSPKTIGVPVPERWQIFLVGGVLMLSVLLFTNRNAVNSLAQMGGVTHDTCQGEIKPEVTLSRSTLADLLAIAERDSKSRVQELLQAPYCQLPPMKVRSEAIAERAVYPLAFDPQTWLVVLYEGEEYVGYEFVINAR